MHLFDEDDEIYDEPPRKFDYDKSDVYPTLRGKIPEGLYNKLNNISKLCLSSHQNLIDQPSEDLDSLCKNIFIKNQEVLTEVYDTFHKSLNVNVASESDDAVEKDLCDKLDRPYKRLLQKFKRKPT